MSERLSEIRERARRAQKATQALRSSTDFERVMGLLAGLGYLLVPDVRQQPSIKVELLTAIKIGTLVEPRVLEVLPAALISNPGSFLHPEKGPAAFHKVVAALKAGRPGPDYEHISFQTFYAVADRHPPNKKRKVISERKIPKTFRLSPDIIDKIEKNSKRLELTLTGYLELLVREATF